MRRLLFSLIVSVLLWHTPSFAGDAKVIAVIVANEQATKMISMPELKLIYWRKKDYWANGKHIHPVNLPADHPLRLQFSNRVLGSLPSAQNDYWNGVYFHGISPPYVLNSEEAILRYVADTNGAIGYINACNTDSRIKVVGWLAETGELLSKQPELRCN